MSDEIELKLQINRAEQIPLLQQQLATLAQQRQQLCLKNSYYDTPSQWLRQQKAALRIRDSDGQYEMTLKTAGQAVAGLHQRSEYNVALSNPQLDVTKLPAAALTLLALPTEQLAQLQLIFRTDFQRQIYLVDYQGSLIECAIDQGNIISDQASLPLCEIELELKQGQVAAIFALAQQLSQLGGLQLSNISKAARGYQLAYPSSTQRSPLLAHYRPIMADKATIEQYLGVTVTGLLDSWQHSEAALHHLPQTLSRLLAVYRQVWLVYGSIITRQATAAIRDDLTAIEQLLTQKLDDEALVNHPHYLSHKLALVANHYLSSWRDLLDAAAIARLQTSAKRFADIMLGRFAAELKRTLAGALTANDYQTKRQKWQKNLDAIWLLSGAYEASLVQAYLQSWQQLGKAIDQQDWQTCAALRQMLAKQPIFWLRHQA